MALTLLAPYTSQLAEPLCISKTTDQMAMLLQMLKPAAAEILIVKAGHKTVPVTKFMQEHTPEWTKEHP